MGKAIVYCGDCGKSLREEDFARGLAFSHEDGPFCVQCRPRPARAELMPAGSSAKLKAIAPAPPSTTRIPAPPATTRRSAPRGPQGSRAGILGGIAAGLILLGILATVFSPGGKEPSRTPPATAVPRPPPSPSAPPPPTPPPPAPSPRPAGEDPTEREIRERQKREEAARLDRFISEIRAMIQEAPRPQDRRAEIEGMIASVEKTLGRGHPQTETLRAQLAARILEAERRETVEPLAEQVRMALGDARRIRHRRDEIEKLIAAVETAGARAEAADLRARAAKAFEEAERRGDLLGHWRLDGNAEDSSGLGFHGKLRGTKTVPGKIGQALWFDGEDSVVELPASPELNAVQEESYTVMAWYRPEDLPPGEKEEDNKSWYAILVKAGMHIGLSFQKSGHVEMGHWVQKDTRAIAVSRAPLPIGEWRHLAGVVDRPGGRTLVYVDGALSGASSWPAGASSRPFGRVPWRIGHASPGWKEWAWPCKGAIDDVRIYGRALAAEEIRGIFEAGKAGRDP